jgi:Mn-dependent DtxR family transcriptional regulator
MNYTQDQTEYLIKEYKNKPTRVTVDRLAKELNKSSKSIIGKLSREGVYQRNVYKLSHETLAGLEKAPKAALKALQIAAGSN